MSVSFSTLVQRARPASSHATSTALRDVIQKIPPTNISNISNGLRVACEQNPIAKNGTIGVFINAGTRHENAHFSGTARVLQKCGFTATGRHSNNSIAKCMDELGGQINANVGREHTHIIMQIEKENTEKAVALLADIIQNARLGDEDILTAKEHVRREQLLFEERPDDVCMDNLFRCAFDSTEYSLGTPLYGTEKGINAIKPEHLQSYRKNNILNGKNIVIVGTGAVDHTTLEKAAQTYFGDIPKGNEPIINTNTNKNNNNNNNNSSSSSSSSDAARFIGGEYKLWNVRFKTTHIAWGFETCGAACEDIIPLSLATEIPGPFHRSQHELGQHAMHRVLKTFSSLDHSTPTNTHFNEKCIEVANPFLHLFKDIGMCGMYIVGRPAQGGIGDGGAMIEVFQYTMAEWCRITQKMIHNNELEQAKVNLKSQYLFNMDGGINAAEDIGRQVLYYGRRVPLEEMYSRIDDVTPTNVQEVLQHYFYGRKPVYSYLGYCANMPGYDWTQHWTYKYWY